jgi:hypothetical protein
MDRPGDVEYFYYNELRDKKFMSLHYFITWKFKLHLTEDWIDSIPTSSDPRLLKITENPNKLKSHSQLMDLYKRLIEQAIKFRKDHYDILEQNNKDKLINFQFLQDMNNLFIEWVNYKENYIIFTDTLGWWKKSKYEEYLKSLQDFPSFSLSYNWDKQSYVRL